MTDVVDTQFTIQIDAFIVGAVLQQNTHQIRAAEVRGNQQRCILVAVQILDARTGRCIQRVTQTLLVILDNGID